MSLSLYSSEEYLGGSNRWSRNESDIVPVKSSIGLISSKISSRPDCSGRSLRPRLCSTSILSRHFSLPSSQSNESVCRARRLGTSSGSVMRAKEMRYGPGAIAEALREAANRGPSELVAERSPRARKTPCGLAPVRGQPVGYDVAEGHVGAAQIGSVVDRHTAGQLICTLIFTAEGSIAPQRPNVKRRRPCVVTL